MAAEKCVRGVPTSPYVDKVIEALGIPSEGQEIMMDDIAAALNTRRHSPRYMTVVAAWKQRLLSAYGIVIITSPGIYRAATDDEKIVEAGRRSRMAGKHVAKAMAIIGTVDARKLSAKNMEALKNLRASMQNAQATLYQRLVS